jgi:hypothetical protein
VLPGGVVVTTYYRHVPGYWPKVGPVAHYECGGPACPACEIERELAERAEPLAQTTNADDGKGS